MPVLEKALESATSAAIPCRIRVEEAGFVVSLPFVISLM